MALAYAVVRGEPPDVYAAEVVDALHRVLVRWSHGRFSGHPEAKVQLRSPHEQVPGYTPLT